MSSPLTAKRRKLNERAQAARKPFISPLKTSKSDPAPLQSNHNASNVQAYQPSVLAHTVKSNPLPTALPSVSRTTATTPAKSTSLRKTPAFATSTARGRDPAEQTAQRALTALELQIRNTRNEIDTLKQAAHLNASSTDAELEELTLTWKLGTQSAAEELFGTVKERVCRMGGVQAWRDSEKQKQNKMNEWATHEEGAADDDADCEFDEDGEELPEDEVEYRKKEKARVRQEISDAMEDERGGEELQEEAKEKKVWHEDEKDDDTFTMDMMLRSLNIDLTLIGWDKVAQRWIS